MQIRSNLSTTASIIYPNGLVENTTVETVMMVEISEISKPLEVYLAPSFDCECIFGINGGYEFGFQENYGSKQWRLPGQEDNPFFERRIHNPRNYVSSLGFNERMFITIRIRGQNVEALFDPGSCRTYLGGPALEKFPGMLRQAKKGTEAKVVYPNGNVDEPGGSLLVCMGIDGVSETIEVRVAPSFEYECVFGMDGANRFGFQVDYGSKTWRLPGLPMHAFKEEEESRNRKIGKYEPSDGHISATVPVKA